MDYCLIQFIEKDPSLSVTVILGLLRIWPKTNSTKELMFLTEIEEILEIISIEHFGQIYGPLFRQLAKCIDSNHFQVAERALMLWHNDYISITLIPEKFDDILRILLPILSKHSKNHWNRNVQILILNALECFMSIDPIIFDSCVAALPEIENESLERKKVLYNCWKELDKRKEAARDDNRVSFSRLSRNQSSRDQLARYQLTRDQLARDQLARSQLYSLLNHPHTQETEMVNIISETDHSSNLNVPVPSSSSSKSIVNTRRKSILPVDTNVYLELAHYSRSSSPSPEEDDKEMKE